MNSFFSKGSIIVNTEMLLLTKTEAEKAQSCQKGIESISDSEFDLYFTNLGIILLFLFVVTLDIKRGKEN